MRAPGNPANPFDLGGRVAIVTGATRGLGRAMAYGLASAGAAVVVCGRVQDRCESAAGELAAETGGTFLPMACHVGDPKALHALVDATERELGRIDVLVNNAGISPRAALLTELDDRLVDKLTDVNVKGPTRLAALVAPRMRAASGGSIVNVLSISAYLGGPGSGAYAASKASLRALTRVMAQEWAAWGVRVNAVVPGVFHTDMTQGAEDTSPGFLEHWAAQTLMRRVAWPREIAGSVVFLASDASSYVTGEELAVAGGMSL